MHYSAWALGRTMSNFKLRPYLAIIKIIISNGTTTDWSTIQGVSGRVISNLTNAQREADLKLRAGFYDTKSCYQLIVPRTKYEELTF